MITTQYKPKITKFNRYPRFLSIDWETLERGFSISTEYGDAKIHLFSSTASGNQIAVGAGIAANKIHQFFLRKYAEDNTAEVIMKVTYEPNEESLGLTNDITDAEEWIQEANIIVRKHQQNK
jgi:hypothetical protein